MGFVMVKLTKDEEQRRWVHLNEPVDENEAYGNIGMMFSAPDSNEEDYEVKKLCFEFSKIIESNEELMQEMFGDHTTVYLTKEKIITEECSHD